MTAAPALLRGAPVLAPPPGRHRSGPVRSRLAWWRSSRRRARDLERPLQPAPRLGRQRLPGVAVDTELHQASDAYERPFGMVLVPATGHASLVLTLLPPGDDLLAAEGAESWIWSLGVWLTLLAHEPHLAGCAVSVLHDPHDADERLRLTAQLTWRTCGANGRTDPAALAVELGARLPHLVNGLRRCDVGTAVPAPAADLLRSVRAAYHPLGADATARSWSEAGPRVAVEAWDRLRHDSATSLTWSLSEVPPDLVLSGVLAQLAAAHAHGRPGAARTRVTLLHRSGQGAGAVPQPPTDWTGLCADLLAPQLDTDPQAGPPHLTSLVTVSVSGPDRELDGAVDGVLTGVAPSLRPWLRPLYGSQAAAFAAAVPTGTLLGVHTAAPAVVREID